ncbi:MAG: DUF1232 domain-containing protein [Deltaproteobacteria bacterium]|nr:DUF1232 domain-containing protein [Deltaproteobacteria bacterium]MBW2723757.1 DUF1232 domain-containing protein [Deltaproteobacteria bacterium]
MPMKVTFELSDQDLEYFRTALAEVKVRAANVSSEELISRATSTLDELPTDAPEFVLERTTKLRSMIEMVNDKDWRLEGEDRERVVRALSYFADPKDLIPDAIPGIGFLDDAIMIELVVQELKHELEAYADFCRLREKKDVILQSAKGSGPTNREEWLEARRIQLQARMQRRRRRRSAAGRRSRDSRSHKSPLSLW